MYDYIIIGAGSAGCVLAHRLGENPGARVLLLEAGPADRRREIHIPAAFTKLFKTDVDWDFETEPQEHLAGRKLYWPRGRMLGGSSSMNAMIYLRGNRADYDEWAQLGNSGWSYEDVLPSFKRAEHDECGRSECYGMEGPLWISDLRDRNPLSCAFVDAAVEAGIAHNPNLNGPQQEGVGFPPVTIRKGRRWSTAAAYLKPARSRSNLTVLTEAQATRLVLDHGRAVGVEYLLNGQIQIEQAEHEVILSGGAINSPQLLMLSGIGSAAHLQDLGIPVAHDLPGVGENLQDHLVVPVLYRSTRPVSMSSAESLWNLLRYVIAGRGPFASNVGEACAFLRVAPAAAAPDMQLIFGPILYRNHNLQPPAPGEHGFTIGAIPLRPSSSGRITLRTPDPLAPPRIDPRYLSDPDGADVRLLVEGVKWARRIVAARPFDPYRGEELDPGSAVQEDVELERFIRRICHTLYHPVGTCRMGTDPMAVVDPELRVRGIEGLRVVDASVMPVITRGHLNATVIMMAEKASEWIAGQSPPT